LAAKTTTSVTSGRSTSSATVGSRDELPVQAGGSAIATTVLWGGTIGVLTGGTTDGTNVSESTSGTVAAGAQCSGTQLSPVGCEGAITDTLRLAAGTNPGGTEWKLTGGGHSRGCKGLQNHSLHDGLSAPIRRASPWAGRGQRFLAASDLTQGRTPISIPE
jgi:hypothetical protein